MSPPPPDAWRHVELDAPAKVNLGLRILGRRPDGYHEIESLFAPLDWADRVHVGVLAGGPAGVEFGMRGGGASPGVPAGAENLAARAAEAFLAELDRPVRVRVELEKRLPAAAGMGGGSSDAGAVLRALQALLPDTVSAGALARIALGLGADVPFFLDPRPALVTGVGERIEPLEGIPELWLVVANPGISLATAEVYACADGLSGALTTAEAGSTMRALSRIRAEPEPFPARLGAAPFGALLDALLVNDLEPAARQLCPGVAVLQEQIRSAGAVATGMSGSGATVFGIFQSETDARGGLMRAGSALTSETSSWARVVRTSGSRDA